MTLPRSIVLARPVVPAEGRVRALRVYGDADDPVRLLVLLAEHLGGLLGTSVHAALEQCTAARSPWGDRLEGLRSLLSAATKLGHAYAALVDPDALAAPVLETWEDRPGQRMRAQFQHAVLDAVDAGGWLVARPWPSPSLTARLDELALIDEPEAGEVVSDPVARATLPFAPDVRPMARWLVHSGRLGKERLDDILEETRDPHQHVLAMTYEALPEGARHAARRLAVARAPQALNGSFGRFGWADAPRAATEIARTDVSVLRAAGFLQEDDSSRPNQLIVPRRARQYVEAIARALDDGGVTEVHHALGDDPSFETRSIEMQIEIHHHAARSGDIDLARSTARYHGVELRALATRVSREQHDHAVAAELFREVVDRFDATDAYAWEYLAYNLARAPRDHERSEEILEAYSKAHHLDVRNPLYHGRWLGYRAQLGGDVRPEVDRALHHYASGGGGEGSVSFFIKPVLDGLARARRKSEIDSIIAGWRTLLEWCAPQVLDKHRGGAFVSASASYLT